MGTKKIDKNEEYISIGLKPSTKLDNGHYEILSNLGEPGGFGITYLGYDCKLNSKVAIKPGQLPEFDWQVGKLYTIRCVLGRIRNV